MNLQRHRTTVALLLAFAASSTASAQNSATPSAGDLPTSSTVATAATARPLRIGFVDFELVLEQSTAIRKVLDKVDQDLDAQSRELRNTQREYRSLQARLDEQGAVLSEEERTRVRDQAARLLDQIDELQFRLDRDVRDRQRKTVAPILDLIIKRIADMGARENYDMILRGEVVLYGHAATDLTGEVLKEIDSHASEFLAALDMKANSADEDSTSTTRRRTDPLLPLIP